MKILLIILPTREGKMKNKENSLSVSPKSLKMNYKSEVLKLEPIAQLSCHGGGDSEWTSIRRAPYRDIDEIGYLIYPKCDDDVWEATYCLLNGIKKEFETCLGPGAPEYDFLPTGSAIIF